MHGRIVGAALALGVAVTPAQATWSILLVNPTTGEIAVGSATCVINRDLRARTPAILPEIGAITVQSSSDPRGINRTFVRDRFVERVHPEDILDMLAVFDPGHESRQYGFVDTLGGVATFTGSNAGAWAGGLVGSFDTTEGEVFYAIQGNVLTGAPVVSEAVVGAMTTDGDLAERLMAAMETASLYGGDGRCSCSSNDPEGCGSPPPEFDKTGHVGYMMVARAGDTPGIHGTYPVGDAPFEAALADLDGDTWPDVVVSTSSGVDLLRNTTRAGDVFVTMAPAISFPTDAACRGIATGDVTGDGVPDVVVGTLDDRLTILAGDGAGGLEPPIGIEVGATPTEVTLADVDLDGVLDLVAVLPGADLVVVVRHDGAGGFLAPETLATGTEPADVVVADMDGDMDDDLVVAERTARTITIFENDASGSFTRGDTFAMPSTIEHVIVADLGGEERLDLVATSRSRRTIEILDRDDPSQVTSLTIEGRGRPVAVHAADVGGDQAMDLVVIDDAQTLWTFVQEPDGTFSRSGYDVAEAMTGSVIGDLNADGIVDASIVSRVQEALVLFHSNPDGSYTDGLGAAAGTFWMNLNVPFQRAMDPDPVEQLRLMFDAWRLELAEVTDAVRSRVTIGPTKIAAGASGSMRISLRTLDGDAPAGVQSVEVIGLDGLIDVLNVVDQGDGLHDVTIEAGEVEGVETFEIRVEHADRTILLMPRPTLEVAPLIGDFDGDGNVWIFDLILFLDAFDAGDASADLNGDTVLDIADVLVMVEAIE